MKFARKYGISAIFRQFGLGLNDFAFEFLLYVIFMTMNHLNKCLIALLICIAFGQSKAQIIWERNWGAVWEDACEVRALPDGGAIFLASIGSIDSWLVRVDEMGDTLWTRRITFADFCAVQPTQDGGFLLGGTTRGNLREEVAYKVDQQGDSIWAYIYPDTIDHGVYTLVALPNSNFLLTGYSRRNNYDMWARCIDETGLSLWAYTYGTNQTEFGALPTLCADGGFLLSTTQNGPGPVFYLVRIDAAGQVLWTRTHAEVEPIGGPVPTALPDGGFVLIGWKQLAGNQYDSFLLRTDSAGAPLWTRRYGGLGFEERSARGVLMDANGGFTFTTITQGTFGPDEDRDIALLRLDTLGNLLDIIRVGRSEDDVPRHFDQLPDSSYVILGYSRSFVASTQQVYLAKIDGDGCNEHFYWPGFPEQDTLCPGDSATLDAGAGFVSYAWSNGDTSRYTQVWVSDTVFVAATDANGCVSYSNFYRGTAQLAPSFTWNNPSGSLVTFDLTGSGGGTWDFGDGSPPVIGSDVSHAYASPGTYLACLTQQLPGCGPFTVCDTVTLLPNSLQTASSAGLFVFPNPTENQLHIQWLGRQGWHAEVRDLNGRSVLQIDSDHETMRLTCEALPAGMYILALRSGEEFVEAKLIVR